MDERGRDVRREGSCIKEAVKSGEVGFSVFKSLAEEQLPLLRLWFLGNQCLCAHLCVCVCNRGERIQGIFLAFDGQLNAQLVKTAVQNVPRAKGQGRSHTRIRYTHTRTIKVKCTVVVLFIRDPVVWVNSHWVVDQPRVKPDDVFLTFPLIISNISLA